MPQKTAYLISIALSAALVAIAHSYGLPFLLRGTSVNDIQYESTLLSWIDFALIAGLAVNYVVVFLRPTHERRFDSTFRSSVSLYILCALAIPVNSADFFAYLEFSRMLFLYHLNPAIVPASTIHDAYSGFSWFDFTSNYGPLAHVIAGPGAWGSTWSPYLGFALLKMSLAGLGVATLFVLRNFLRTHFTEEKATRLLMLFALNPFWLLEAGMNGHNDVLGVYFLMLAGVSFLRSDRARTWFGAVALVFFKFPPGVFSAYLATKFFFGREKKLSFAIVLTVLSGVGLFFASMHSLVAVKDFLHGNSLINDNSFVGRIGWLLSHYAKLEPNLDRLPMFVAALVGLLMIALAWRDRHRQNFAGVLTLLLLLVYVAASQLWPWYALWILPLAVLHGDRRMFAAMLWLSIPQLLLYSPAYWAMSDVPPKNILLAWPSWLPLLTTSVGLVALWRAQRVADRGLRSTTTSRPARPARPRTDDVALPPSRTV